MTTYVLVTGAWHGGWCWKRVRDALVRQGHAVFTPTFTGLCERSHLMSPDIDLETHIADIINLIRWEQLEDVVLVGHSYGGCVISGVADRLTAKIKALVYLDAFVLKDGQSLHDTLPPEHRQAQLDRAAASGNDWQVPPIPAAVFNVNEADRAWVDAQCTPQPLASFQQKLTLVSAGVATDRIHYIFASGWEGTPFTAFYEAAKARGWRTREIACGHDIMLDQPEALSKALLDVGAA